MMLSRSVSSDGPSKPGLESGHESIGIALRHWRWARLASANRDETPTPASFQNSAIAGFLSRGNKTAKKVFLATNIRMAMSTVQKDVTARSSRLLQVTKSTHSLADSSDEKRKQSAFLSSTSLRASAAS